MSHIVKVKVQVKNLAALRKACEKLGLVFREGQKTHKWYGRFVGDAPIPEGMKAEDYGKCDHAIVVPGNTEAYEVGVVDQKDGTYGLVWDSFMGGLGLQDKVGAECGLLRQMYATEEARSQMEGMGFQVFEDMDKQGVIRLACER